MAGRPWKYRPEMCEEVLDYGRQGMGMHELADALGVTYRSFLNYREQFPDFAEAVEDASALSQAWWERQGRIATFGGIEGFHSTAYIFQMKNRFSKDWRDKHETEHSGNLTVNRVERVIVDPNAANPDS